MDNMFNISIDYAKTISQADELIKISNKCNDIRNDIIKEIQFIESNWKGKTGEALCEKLRAFQKKSSTVSENLNQVAGTMKRVANDIRQADSEASARIKDLI